MENKNDRVKRIEELKKELSILKAEQENNSGIKPSETEELIKKYYGHCFRFEGYESGSIEMMLNTIEVDRDEKSIRFGGDFIIYVTPDISFLEISKGLWPYGGTLICKGSIDTRDIPYSMDLCWDIKISDVIDQFLSDHEISFDEFIGDVETADDCVDNIGYLRPLDEIIKEKNKKYHYDYDEVFGKL